MKPVRTACNWPQLNQCWEPPRSHSTSGHMCSHHNSTRCIHQIPSIEALRGGQNEPPPPPPPPGVSFWGLSAWTSSCIHWTEHDKQTEESWGTTFLPAIHVTEEPIGLHYFNRHSAFTDWHGSSLKKSWGAFIFTDIYVTKAHWLEIISNVLSIFQTSQQVHQLLWQPLPWSRNCIWPTWTKHLSQENCKNSQFYDRRKAHHLSLKACGGPCSSCVGTMGQDTLWPHSSFQNPYAAIPPTPRN